MKQKFHFYNLIHERKNKYGEIELKTRLKMNMNRTNPPQAGRHRPHPGAHPGGQAHTAAGRPTPRRAGTGRRGSAIRGLVGYEFSI